ncbi:MAG: hypothetical protein GVY12_05465 [Bacteroidetes bacterium]|jgi:hypothetical protein|nr:hypothetical protein [Bacteroidota bacterium]
MTKLARNAMLMAGVAAHFVLSGAALFGDVVIAPVVLSAPPASLEMFQGPYAYDSTPFWKPANMISLAIVIGAVALNWGTPRRKLVLAWGVGFLAVTVVSLGFVFPEYIEITATPFSNTIDPALVERGANWRVLSWARGALYAAIGFLPMAALTQPVKHQDGQHDGDLL